MYMLGIFHNKALSSSILLFIQAHCALEWFPSAGLNLDCLLEVKLWTSFIYSLIDEFIAGMANAIAQLFFLRIYRLTM